MFAQSFLSTKVTKTTKEKIKSLPSVEKFLLGFGLSELGKCGLEHQQHSSNLPLNCNTLLFDEHLTRRYNTISFQRRGEFECVASDVCLLS